MHWLTTLLTEIVSEVFQPPLTFHVVHINRRC